MIEVKELTKRFGTTVALDSVSLDVHEGELFALLGPNGAGKTTLVHILCTILAPDGGVATVGGVDVAKFPRRARRSIGVVFQEPSLDDRLTVYENLDFHGRIYGVSGNVRQHRIVEMLELVELGQWRDHLVRNLSTGMKRRLEIARCLIHEPALLFLDEPTVGLDAQTRSRIWEYIRNLQRSLGTTILVTTHYIEEVEGCTRVCIIDHGKILALGTPSDLKATYGQERLRIRLKDDSSTHEVRRDLAERYGNLLWVSGDELQLISTGEAFVEEFLSEYGTKIRAMSAERVSLENVFLSLTGREIRDDVVGPRDRLYAFGTRGGEHTK